MSPSLLLRATCSLVLLGYGWILSTGKASWYPGESDHTFEIAFLFLTGVMVLLPLFIERKEKLFRYLEALLVPASGMLFYFSSLKWTHSGVGIAQFLEHAAQFGAPYLLFLVGTGKWIPFHTLTARVLVSAAFFFHGVFAIGIESSIAWLNHPTPDKFYFMTMQCLGVDSRETAGTILKVAGTLDFAAVIAIWIPSVRKPALLYMIAWGFLTAMARPVAYFDPTIAGESLYRWVPEFLVRSPHWLFPLILLQLQKPATSQISESASAPEPSRPAPL